MFKETNFSNRKFNPLKVLSFVLIFAVIFTLVTFLVMFLWNSILTDVAGFKRLNFWKAGGILILSKILFGGLKGHRSHATRKKNHWKNKWMEMDPEKRKEAKMRYRQYCEQRKSSDKNEY